MAGNSENKILSDCDDTQTEAEPLVGVFDAPDDHNEDRRAPVPTRKRGVGRPKGSLNRRTEAVRDEILSLFGDPAHNLATIGAFTIPDLKDLLQCSMLEAARYYRDVQNDLMPYVHSKRPQGVTIETPNVAPVQLIIPKTPAAQGGAGLRIESPTKSRAYQIDDDDVTVEPSPLDAKQLNSLENSQ